MFETDRTDVPADVPSSADLDLSDQAVAPSDDTLDPGSGPRPRRPGRPALPLTRPQAIVATVAVLTTALVGGLLAWGSRTPDTARPSGSQVADASRNPDPSSSPAASPSTGPEPTFEPIAGASAAPTAVLTARGAVGAVVPLDARFRLESTVGTPAAILARSLTVDPAVKLSFAPVAGADAVLVTPAKPLRSGGLYRFALHGASGELLDTWAFQAQQPLRIVGTLPDTQSTDVPLDTGIELTFDQDGVENGSSHVSVQPATAGRFEQHGRTLVFIPDRPLAPSTIYNVTVTRGIKVPTTGEATNVDTRIQFETAAESSSKPVRSYEFPEDLVESAVAKRPQIAIWSADDADTPPPATTHLDVYRLASIDAGIAAFRTLRARPSWTRWSSAGLVDVRGLTRVVSADVPLRVYRSAFWVELPGRLPAGWYVVQQADGTKPIQTVLQVTDVSGYLAVSDAKTIIWANDLATGGPLAAAAASSDGVRFGQTGADGLLAVTTPKSLLPETGSTCDRPCAPVVVVTAADGRRAFLPVSGGRDRLDGYGGLYWWSDADTDSWSLLHTDRSRYRRADVVNVWGMVRDRDTGDVPSSVTLRLVAEGGDDNPSVATITSRPNATGAFVGSIPLSTLPEGYYTIRLEVGKRVIRSTWLVVGAIAKPAYQLDVTTGRRVYIVGDRVTATINARFFEGTPVSGVPLALDAFRSGSGSATTDSLGTAVWHTVATVDPDEEGPSFASINARPARAEEGEIDAGSATVFVYPSTRTIDVTGEIAGGRVVASGGVHQVAVSRLEKELASGQDPWSVDPRGAAIRGATVTVEFTELIPVRRQVGTEYDFVEKKVVPIYETNVTERAAGSVHVVTAADGSWTASIPASVADHTYRIQASVADADGHRARTSTSASRSAASPYEERPFPSLTRTVPAENGDETYGIGDRIDLRMTDPDLAQTAGDGTRYLFFTAQRGIHGAVAQASRRYVTTFPSWGAPDISIGAVRFTGDRYVGTTWYSASFRVADRRLSIDLSPDASRYQPGQSVTVDVRTRDAEGAPTAATVVLRAIDEKLFSIGAADAEDPLNELYAGVDSGVIGTYRSHRSPEAPFEGGDTTGGGGDDRDDFRDSLLFTSITTDADGRGSVTFRLSDDLTSWRITAAGITRGFQAGVGSVLVPVGLPFFVDASVAPEYLVADRPTIAVRTYGTAVGADTPVTIRVTSASLGFDSGPLQARAFAGVDVPLPALHLGSHAVTIEATTGSGASARTDRLVRRFDVVTTRLTREQTSFVALPASGPFAGGTGFTTVQVADASAGQYLSLLNGLASGAGARLDRALSADLASRLLADRFGSEPDDTAVPFDASRYQAADGGLTLVPYSSSDLELSVLVAIVAPTSVDRVRLTDYLRTIRGNPEETRERQMFALAGLAGLGEAVLPAIRSAATADVTVREQLMLGIGAARLGDAATARTILDAVVRAGGEQAGSVARIRVGSTAADITEATALTAVLAASVGDPLAPRFWAYVEANPEHDRLEVLPAIAFVTATLDRLPVQSARFAWTVDGTRKVVDLRPGEAFTVVLTSSQLASLSVERLTGTLGVTTTWREPVAPDAFTPDPDFTIVRSVRPATSISSADLVVVDLVVKFDPQAATGCRQVTDLLPSGLTPVGGTSHWIDADEENAPPTDVIYPYDQTASSVSFCVAPDTQHPTITLRYVARVVTAGTYVWEPALAQSETSSTIANLTPVATLTIR